MKDGRVIDQNTLIPVGVIATMVGAAFTFGVMFQRFTSLEGKVQTVETRLAEFQSDFYRVFYPEKIREQIERTASQWEFPVYQKNNKSLPGE